MWLLLAILSSIFAALTSILAKVGINGVNSTLATAIRTVVVLVMAWGEELDISNFIRNSDRSIMVMLF